MINCPLCSADETSHFADANGKPYWRCPVCQLTFLPTAYHLDHTAQHQRYSTHQNNPNDPDYRNFLSRLSRHLLPRLTPGAEGLDYGSGPGPTLSVMFRERGFPMTNYDPFFTPDTAALEQSYDFITCTETVEHFARPAEDFQQLDLLLRPDGWLGIMTEWLASDQNFPAWHYHRDPTHICFFKRETMAWIGRRFGWTVNTPANNVTLFHKPRA